MENCMSINISAVLLFLQQEHWLHRSQIICIWFTQVEDVEVTLEGQKNDGIWVSGPLGLLFSWDICSYQIKLLPVPMWAVRVSVAPPSWQDNNPGCSSRCYGSHSCHTGAAGKKEWIKSYTEVKCLLTFLVYTIYVWAHLVPAAVSPVRSLSAHVSHRGRGCCDGDLRHGLRGFCRHSNSRIFVTFPEFLCVFLPKTQTAINQPYKTVHEQLWARLSPVLCSSFCSTQLLQQFLVAFIQRENTATDMNLVNHSPENKRGSSF